MFTRHCMAVGSSSYATGLFRVPLQAARDTVADDYFTVAEIFPGEAVFFIGTGEFRVTDFGPYKEMYVGFYTENRQLSSRPGQVENLAEFTRNESKMYMWKNWVTTDNALERMEKAGSGVFRRGEIERIDDETHTRFSMQHPSEGSIEFSTPRTSDLMQSDFPMTRTHYGRLHGVPSRVQLDLNIERMVTIPGQGALTLGGLVADECEQLRIPKEPMVSIWIDEMNFKMGKPLELMTGSAGE